MRCPCQMAARALLTVALPGQAPVLGHSALRCAGLSRSELRLQMLPATLCLVGFLVITISGLKLALARQLFSIRQILFLALCGFLEFTLSVISVKNPDHVASPGMGGLLSLVCLFQLLAFFEFLPPQGSLPALFDRLLAAFLTSSLVLNVLTSVHTESVPSSPARDLHNMVYAEAACLVCFYLSCIAASQFHRIFTYFNHDTEALQPINKLIPLVANITLLSSLFAFLAQACLAFSLPRSFAVVMTASMASALGYLLLVSTFVILNRATPAEQRDEEGFKVQHLEPYRPAERGIKAEGQENVCSTMSQLAANGGQAQGSRSMTHLVDSEKGSIIWSGGTSQCFPEASHNHDNRAYRSSRVASGHSISSWGRVQQLMRRGRGGGGSSVTGRPYSGVTYYGSESSFVEGMLTARNSMLSSVAYAAAGHGLDNGRETVPPVPRIDPRFYQSQSDVHIGFAKPLTNGEEPIALNSGSTILFTASSTVNQRAGLKGALSSLSCLLSGQAARKRKDSRHETPSVSSLVQTPSIEGLTTLPARYQSSKLFPATEWDRDLEISAHVALSSGPQSPNDSEVKHSGLVDAGASPVTRPLEILPRRAKHEQVSASVPPPSPSPRSRATKVIRCTSTAEDAKTSLTASIMFPKK